MALSAEDCTAFERWTEGANPPLEGNMGLNVGALMSHAALAEPERTQQIFDAITEAWLDEPDAAKRPALLRARLPFLADAPVEPTPIPRFIWDRFWAIVQEPPGEIDALGFTGAVAAINVEEDLPTRERCERALLMHEDVRKLLEQPEVRLTMKDLEGWSKGSLGEKLHTMLTENGFDIEVLDADSVVLEGDFPALNRTNRRILQLHDVWHLFAGYDFTPGGEVAISGFQLAQFGQSYSARFLAATTTLIAIHAAPIADLFIALIGEGWRHGRTTPPLMSYPWHEKLGATIEELRDEIGATEFKSQFAALLPAA